MLDRVAHGELPPKAHLALRGKDGTLRHEECVTRAGFDGPYSILYHLHRPHPSEDAGVVSGFPASPVPDGRAPSLRRRHFRTEGLARPGSSLRARAALVFNDDVVLSVVTPTESDPSYLVDADSDELFFVRRGEGIVRSPYGDLRFSAQDYVCIPKGTPYRLVLDGPVDALLVECRGGLGIPEQFRNGAGQLRMDAPYGHRDFRRPEFRGPLDEGIRDVIVRRGGVPFLRRLRESPLDVVGWDGTVYPWALPILAFQPRVSSIHLPPTVHGTFAARGALVCSFVPRPLDFHPDAVPCPYPHSSVDVDEVLYYVSGEFGSRRGVGEGSLTLHPAGIPHGPHPGRYEASLGAARTDEIAVMLDCHRPLRVAAEAVAAEDLDYDASFGAA